MESQQQQEQIITTHYSGNWLILKSVKITEKIEWEFVERKDRDPGHPECVHMIAKIFEKNKQPDLVLVLMFRPCINSLCLEFPKTNVFVKTEPAVEQSALESLKRLTGYEGKILDVSPVIYDDPWKSNERGVFVRINIDKEENKEPVSGGGTEVVLLEDGPNLLKEIERIVEAKGCTVEAKVYTYALAKAV